MTAAASTTRSSGWLYGPLPDLLFGCGLLYALLFVAFAVFGPSLRVLQPTFLIPVLILFVSMPHYGGTLVRVYDQRKDRRAYAIFSIWATALLAALFVWGAFSTLVASVLFTIYITWSPWHYTGQNYGLAVMFLRRSGVPLAPGSKRLLHASFVLAYLLTFLVFHSAMGVIDYNTSLSDNPRISFLPLGIPVSVHGLISRGGGGLPGTLVACAALLLREAGARPDPGRGAGAGPGALVLDPVRGALPRRRDRPRAGRSPDQPDRGLLQVGRARARGAIPLSPPTTRAARGAGTASRATSARCSRAASRSGRFRCSSSRRWCAAITSTPEGRALVASVVNLHHFVMDGAIWKLRNSRIASVLIRPSRRRRPSPRRRARPAGAGSVLWCGQRRAPVSPSDSACCGSRNSPSVLRS